MEFEELLEYLDLDKPADFQYFEAMADLVESETEITPEAMYQLLAGVDHELVAQIAEDYFEDLLEGLPEDASEMYGLLQQIKMSMIGMLRACEDEDDIRKLADEVYRFRNWFSEESEVYLTPEEGGKPIPLCLRDAIATARMEKLGGDRYTYDFDRALDYELDDYSMSFADLIAAGDEDVQDAE